jgi:hypothetical protein
MIEPGVLMGIAPRRPQPETIQSPAWDHGVDVAPSRVLKDGALICPDNVGAYKGCNACWREGHGHVEDID